MNPEKLLDNYVRLQKGRRGGRQSFATLLKCSGEENYSFLVMYIMTTTSVSCWKRSSSA